MPTPNYLVIRVRHALNEDDLNIVSGLLEPYAENPNKLAKERSCLNAIRPYKRGPWTPAPTPFSISQHFIGPWAAEQRARLASHPFFQARVQIQDEVVKISLAVYFNRLSIPRGHTVLTLAEHRVRLTWLRQGIFNFKLSKSMDFAEMGIDYVWPHEMPPTPGLEPRELAKLSQRERGLYQAARIDRERHKKVSNPFLTFVCHLAQEGRWKEFATRNNTQLIVPIKLGSRDVRVVRRRWQRWGIWDYSWGVLPGLTWAHERAIGEPDMSLTPLDYGFRVGKVPKVRRLRSRLRSGRRGYRRSKKEEWKGEKSEKGEQGDTLQKPECDEVPPPRRQFCEEETLIERRDKEGRGYLGCCDRHRGCCHRSQPPVKPKRRSHLCQRKEYIKPAKKDLKPKKEGKKNISATKNASVRGPANRNNGLDQIRTSLRMCK